MTILFYIGHPAHYHNFKNVIKSLVGMGLQVLLLVRPKDVVLDLIEGMNVPVHILPEKSGSNKISMVLDVLKRNLLLWKLKRKHSISMMIGTDLSITQIAKFTGAKSIVVNEDDAEAVPLFSKTAYPLATHLLMPEGCSAGRFEAKTIRYKGYHELAYLHPNHFTGDARVIEKAGLSKKGYIVMRFSALNAHHDTGVQGIDDAFALNIIHSIGDKYQVIITSERPLSASLEPYRMKFHPKEMHHVLAFAKAFIGDSQTMAAEAMVLGTPSIRCNSFVGRLAYLEELENHYQLGVGILPESRDEIIDAIGRWLLQDDLEQVWQERRNAMLKDKIDVAAYWTELFIELSKA